jgi:hypothetical protein
MQRLRFQTLPIVQAGRQTLKANLRPTTTKQALRTKATQDGNAFRSQAPNEKGRLHVQTIKGDLQDGLYALGISPTDREYFTVNVRGELYRLAGLPMGWSLPPFYFFAR